MLELNKIYNEDCLEGMKQIDDNSVDLVITSPPYADRRKNCYDGKNEDEYVEWFVPIAKEIKRILKPTGSFFLNIKPHCDKGERVLYVIELIIALKKEVGFRYTDEFCWTKLGVPGKFVGRFKNGFEPVYHFTKEKGYTFNPYEVAEPAKQISLDRYKRKACGESTNGSGLAGMRKEITSKLALPSNVLYYPQKSNQYTIQSKHPAVFPVELVNFFIKAFSNERDIVLDPFMGSGTTAIACIETNRQYIGFELDDTYYELCEQRIVEHII